MDKCTLEKIDNPRPGFPGILKQRFIISYQWEQIWAIVVYELER